MDIFSFLTLVIVSTSFAVSMYFMQKNHLKLIDKLMEKFSQKEVVSLPWQQAVDNPEAQMKDDDHVPLDELEEDDLKKNISHMFTVQEKDEEAEKAQEEIN